MEEERYFINKDKNPVKINVNIDNDFCYIDYHTACKMAIENNNDLSNYFSFIKGIEIINKSFNTYDNLTIKFYFLNDAFSTSDIHIVKLNIHEKENLRMPFIKVNRKFLSEIKEALPSSLRIELINNNKVISEADYHFNILPISQPSIKVRSIPQLYAKLVTPLSNEVKQITLLASKILGKSIVAYQNKINSKEMILELEAIYKAVHQTGINYQNPPAGGIKTQRVRMPFEVVNDKKATCLDISILFCSCLEEVGYHSILVVVDTHAFVGVFLDPNLKGNNDIDTSIFSDGIEERIGVVTNLANTKLLFFNAVDACVLSDKSFKSAIEDATNNYLYLYRGNSFSAIDINTCHKMIYSPIPSLESEEELNQLINPIKTKDEAIDPIIDVEYINVLKEEEKDRFTYWEKKLLDLKESNPLVKFNLKLSNCIKLISKESPSLLLADNDSIKIAVLSNKSITLAKEEEMLLLPNLKPSNIIKEQVKPNIFYSIGLEKTLKALMKKSKDAMDETGASTLYLCLGLLTYQGKYGKNTAPFMVLPIKKISKDKMNSTYTICYDFEELMLNQTFFEYYKVEHPEIDFSKLYGVSSIDGYLNIVHTFKKNNIADIALDESTFFLANLTFSHYIMWNDMRKRKDELKKNTIVQSIIESQNLINETPEYLTKPVDEIEHYLDFAAPLPYDSTQLRAILECGAGRSFVLDGPPGTGKSQTIVNMIVNAFYHGKTVLFVAEKKAALDVVAERLDKFGLGRFCLELHSNKANKDDFYSKLADSMEKGACENPDDYEEKCIKLEKQREYLLKTINDMHKNNKYIYSFYDAIVKQMALNEEGHKYSINLDEKFLESYTQKEHEEILELLNRYIYSAKNVKDFDNNPLKVFNIENINFNDKYQTIEDFKNEKEKYNLFYNDYLKLLPFITLNISNNIYDIKYLMEALELIFNEELYLSTIDMFQAYIDDSKNLEVFNESKLINEFCIDNANKFKIELLNTVSTTQMLDLLKKEKNFFKKAILNHKCKKLIKPVLQDSYIIKNDELINILEQIKFYNEKIIFIKNNCKQLNKMIGFDYFENVKNEETIRRSYLNTRKLIGIISYQENKNSIMDLLSFYENIKNNSGIKMMFNSINEKYKDLKEYEKYFYEKYLIDYESMCQRKNEIKEFDDILNYCTNENNFIEFLSLASLNQIGKKLNEIGLNDLLLAVKNQKISINDIKETLELSLANKCIDLYFKYNNDINYFNAEDFDRQIEKYKECINSYSNVVIECVAAKLSKELTHNAIDYKSSSPIGQLKKAFSLKRGKPAIRETLLKYDDIIRKYFPCFLMSPLSAAQYLAVDDNNNKGVAKFDLVIFDEASQIPLHEAIGPIARGNSLIVAGDPLQMPPSNYFTTGIEVDEEDMSLQDAASLLDECLAINLPRIRLNYHYRSKHESLISFSNQYFYQNGLYTFPSPSTANSEVILKYVDVNEEKDKTKLSKNEMKAICNTFKEIYSNPKTKNKSVGIIVFNIEQKYAVDEAIDELLNNDQRLYEQVLQVGEKTKEEYFVKSLENVQGDERDIIILCISFAKGSNNRPRICGAITNENGERRLNVAASRSKEKMIIISSIKSSEFETDEVLLGKSKGTLYLKKLLRFAEYQSFDVNNVNGEDKESITYFIKKDLISRGYEVDSNVGNSQYKVDLAIKNNEGDQYQLGILIDTKSIENNVSCRDKLYLQDSFLKGGLKWKIKHVYAVEYYMDPTKTVDKIVAALSEEAKPYSSMKIDPEFKYKKTEKVNYQTKEYVNAQYLFDLNYDKTNGFDNSFTRFLKKIIDEEGPVSLNTIKNYVLSYTDNLKKFDEFAEKSLLNALESIDCLKTLDRDDKNNRVYFYWPKGAQSKLTTFRISGKEIFDIPKEEIAEAMRQILSIQVALEEFDLFKETLDAFKCPDNTLSSKNKKRLEYVYIWAKDKRII